MDFNENLNVYFADMGQNIYFNGQTKKGILNMPDEILAGDMIVATDYELQVQTLDFEDVVLGDVLEIFVNNIKNKYEVRTKRMVDDGKMSVITLSKTWLL